MNPLRSLLTDAYVGLTWPLRRVAAACDSRRQAAPVAALFYHRVADTHPTPWSIDRETFRRQILWIERHFDLVSIEEAQRRIVHGHDRPSVVLTFDDGYRENADWALPWLLDRRIPITYYVSTGFVGSRVGFPHDVALGLDLPPDDLLTLNRWKGSTLSFGGHTRTHADLGRVDDPQVLIDELVTATGDLARLLDEPIVDFAFPYGQPRHLHPSAFEIARQAGLRSVASAYGELNRRGDDPFHLRRIHGDPSLARLRNHLTDDPRHRRRSPFVPETTRLPEGLIVPLVAHARQTATPIASC
ncbi:MAG TPA: xylanase [Planctomycetaceae bacterium]|nr:xylanase [Planctomycetaceae bacterium]HRF00953.1 polysaccharide deacetylase family protein [Pirellulaceae bacterium]